MHFIGLGRLGESAVQRTGLVDEELEFDLIVSDRWFQEDVKNAKKRGTWSPQDGREAAEKSLEEGNYDFLEEARHESQVLIVAGMGGGVGTGAAPVLAEFAKNHGLLTVALVTKPFRFEGKKRTKWAEDAITELERVTDMIVVVPNDSLFALTDQVVTVEEAFLMATRTMAGITQSVAEIMRYKPPRGSRRSAGGGRRRRREAFEAVDELVGGLAGDAEAPGEVGDGVVDCDPSGDEDAVLVERGSAYPGQHWSSSVCWVA